MSSGQVRPEELRTLDAEVMRCDVAIVGGGIAGIACAERLSREARRQSRRLRILLVEQAGELGGGTSSRLEGWYHTGALYAKQEDPRMFTYFLFAFEDLYNWYSYDPAFLFHRNCNLAKITKKSPRPQYEFGADNAGRWFLSPISFVLPRELTGKTPSYAAKYSKSDWKAAAARAKWLIANAFFICEWCNNEFRCVQAPHLKAGTTSSGDFHIPVDLVDDHFPWILRDALTEAVNEKRLSPEAAAAARQAAVTELASREDELGVVGGLIERMAKLDDIGLDVMITRDAVMDTYNILHDLARAAAAQGVKFLTGCRLDPDAVQVSRSSGTVRSLRVSRVDGGSVQVLADQYVFALGHGFAEDEFLRKTLNVRVRIEKTASVMAVARPPCGAHSFARLDHYPERTYNHICHPGRDGDPLGAYSIVADANGLPATATLDEDCYDLARTLLVEKTEKIFGGRVNPQRLGWYSCMKTEGISEETTRREYSYWLTPRLEYSVTSEAWGTAKDANQKSTQDDIKKKVRGESVELAAPLEESGWALNKAMHFALQRLAFARTLRAKQAAAEGFQGFRKMAIDAYKKNFATRKVAAPNYICIVPGKFSLFPTIAHQVYLEMEGRGVFNSAEVVDGGSRALDEQAASNVKIAARRAEDLLGRLTDWDWS